MIVTQLLLALTSQFVPVVQNTKLNDILLSCVLFLLLALVLYAFIFKIVIFSRLVAHKLLRARAKALVVNAQEGSEIEMDKLEDSVSKKSNSKWSLFTDSRRSDRSGSSNSRSRSTSRFPFFASLSTSVTMCSVKASEVHYRFTDPENEWSYVSNLDKELALLHHESRPVIIPLHQGTNGQLELPERYQNISTGTETTSMGGLEMVEELDLQAAADKISADKTDRSRNKLSSSQAEELPAHPLVAPLAHTESSAQESGPP
jgi:hypothetical protein